MFENLVLGIIQGAAEWLPVSSEGLIVLVKTHFFGGGSFEELIKLALFLHLGTFLAALIYFWRDVIRLFQSLVNYQEAKEEDKKVLTFLIGSTIVSGLVGLALLKTAGQLFEFSENTGQVITVFIGILLLATAWFQLKKKELGAKSEKELGLLDTLILGVAQGLAVLPGLSRSGLTVAGLLLRRFGDTVSLRLSFIMSLPVVLGANIFLNSEYFIWRPANLFSLLISFIVGLATIHGFLIFSRKVNIGWFILVFGLLMIVAGVFI